VPKLDFNNGPIDQRVFNHRFPKQKFDDHSYRSAQAKVIKLESCRNRSLKMEF